MPDHIDWNDVRRRIAENEAALEHGIDAGPEAKLRVLRERAAKLEASASAEQDTTELHAVIFRRGSVRYATELERLQEIQICRGVTWLPALPPWCLGVINLRGEILPIFDIALLFDGAAEAGEAPQRILVVEADGHRIGLAADDVDDAAAISSTDLDTPLATFSGRRAELVRGIARGALLLDCRALAAGEQLVID